MAAGKGAVGRARRGRGPWVPATEVMRALGCTSRAVPRLAGQGRMTVRAGVPGTGMRQPGISRAT